MATTPSSTPKPEKPTPAVEADGALEDKEQTKFSPEEEAELVAESNSHKAEANTLFTSAKYEAALRKYDEAVAVCPNYLDYELAVLKSNIAACHLKLDEWKEAIKSATGALKGLDRLSETEKKESEKADDGSKVKDVEEDDVEEEIVSAGASKAAPALPKQDKNNEEISRRKREEDILRIRAKALMRRARARSELGGWSNLASAEDDYKTLSAMTNLSAPDRKLVQRQLRELPPRTKVAQEKEVGEMWGKLKDLGNGILKPFGLSTENFQMVKDEKTGGYSMNFNSNDNR